MTEWREVWMARSRWWVPALVFFVLNFGLLLTYRIGVAARMGAERAGLAEAETQAASLTERRAELEAALAEARATEVGIADLKQVRLGRLEERLTATMARVKELAARAGLRGPTSLSYPEEEVEGFGLTRKAFVFRVSGSYQDLREFINLLELSDSFLVLEAIELKGASAGNLEIQLRLSTLFLTPEGPRRRSS